MSLIQAENVGKIFKDHGLPVQGLGGISLKVEEGEFSALSGPSGSGKTTFLNLVGCLDRPSSGRILFDGEEVSRMNQEGLTRLRLYKIGFIFQDYNLIPTLSVAENIEYTLWLQGVRPAERRKRALAIAERFGIAKFLQRRPSQISRGQQQRVAVARAIVHKPRIVLGDELTANLDHKTGIELMNFLKDLNRNEKITFLYATHDPIMLEYADRIIRLQDGELLEIQTAQTK